MKFLFLVSLIIGTLLVMAMLGAFLAACWTRGHTSNAWVGTGFVLLFACLPMGVAIGMIGDQLDKGKGGGW